VSSYVAVADFEGYVHLLSQVDGEILGRVRPDKDGVRADMLSSGNTLYVFGNSGKLQAYDITSLD
jgi:outer membrane protein assembly factor BamB